MADSSKKLVTWKAWVVAISAAALGVSTPLYREYRDSGTVQTSSILLSAAVFCIGLGIIIAVFWYANRPELEDEQ